MTKPKWLKKWMKMQFMCNFYPCMAGFACFVLMLVLPDNVLTLHPWLRSFTNFMSRLVPSIPAFSKHMQPHEPSLLVYALSWAILPLWLKLYLPKQIFEISNIQLRTNLKKSSTFFNQHHGYIDKIVYLFLPLMIFLFMWICWSDYLFRGDKLPFGKLPLIGVKGYTGSTSLIDNPFSIAIWSYLFTQAFMISMTGLAVSFRLYPLYIRTYLKLIFLKDKK